MYNGDKERLYESMNIHQHFLYGPPVVSLIDVTQFDHASLNI